MPPDQPQPDAPVAVRPRRILTRCGLSFPDLSVGCGTLGNLYRPVSDEDAAAVVDQAFALGIDYFDTAPYYGFGLSERRLGEALRGRDRGGFLVSTKVGCLLRPRGPGERAPHLAVSALFPGAPPLHPVVDFSHDGILRSLSESLERLALDRVDIVYIHDPESHLDQALRDSLRALCRLREEGVVRAIGAGSNDAAALACFVETGSLDCVLLAGRYTLLEQGALETLLPLCERERTGVIMGGVFNSGILSGAAQSRTYDYGPPPADVLSRVGRLAKICRDHGAEMAPAALQFPLGHPAVVSVLTGVRSAVELEENVAAIDTTLASALWRDLRRSGLIASGAPTPGAAASEASG